MLANYGPGGSTNPDTFTFVQIHRADPYQTLWGLNRSNTFYGWQGTPDAWFDGLINCLGAWPTVQEQYDWYEDQYDTRRAATTYVIIDLVARDAGPDTYDVRATICVEAEGTETDMRIYMVQVLDNWPATPTYSRNGFKQAADLHGSEPNITVAAGECEVIEKTFTLDATSSANEDDVKIIAWAQEQLDDGPAEVYQAARMSWPFPSASCNALAVRSYRVHDAAGDLYLDMGVSGGIEPRLGGIVDLEIDLDDSWGFGGGATVDCSTAWGGTVDATLDGDTVILTFDPALPDQSYCTITLDCGAEVCVRSLLGDVDRSATTATTDGSAVKPYYGQTPVQDSTVQYDVDCNGTIATTDKSAIKPYYGNTVADCP